MNALHCQRHGMAAKGARAAPPAAGLSAACVPVPARSRTVLRPQAVLGGQHHIRTADHMNGGLNSSHERNVAPSSPIGLPPQSLSTTVVESVPEVVWGPGKTPDQIATCMMALAERQRVVMAARITPETYAAVRLHAPGVEYNARSHTLKLRSPMADELPKPKRLPGSIAVVSADTADQAVAEEVRVLSDYLGGYAYKIAEAGASNLNKLLSQADALRAADVVVVVCGQDCALPSVVAGLTSAPVVAVPTSCGSGAALGGLTPLLAVVSSSMNILTVNIDGGHAAAAAAVRMLRMASRLHEVRSKAEAALLNGNGNGSGHHQ